MNPLWFHGGQGGFIYVPHCLRTVPTELVIPGPELVAHGLAHIPAYDDTPPNSEPGESI